MEYISSKQHFSAEETSAFRGMPNELLEIYLNQYKVAGYLSEQNGAALQTYRDQLSAFDQTIQEYQDILDGKTALPKQMQQEKNRTTFDE